MTVNQASLGLLAFLVLRYIKVIWQDFFNSAVVLISLLISHCNQGSVGPQGTPGFPGAQGRQVRGLEFDQKFKHCALDIIVSRMSQYIINININNINNLMPCCRVTKEPKGFEEEEVIQALL